MSINKFITNLDLSRQAEILSGETAIFQGGIQLGVPFSGFPSGVDTTTIVSLGVQEIQFTSFSGGSGTTIFDVVNPSSPYYSVSATTLSASPYTVIDVNTITETVSATTYPTIMMFTTLSGDCCSTPINVSFTPSIIQELYDRGLYDGLFNGLGQANTGTTYIDESFYNVGSVFSGANLNMVIVEYGVHGSNPSWVTGTTSGTVIEYSALTQYWTNPIYENLVSGLTLPITPESADTQTSDYVWTLTDSTIIDDNLIGLQYTGYSVTYSFNDVIIDPESPSITGGVTGATSADTYYLGTVTATLENFSAGTLDYKNSIEWLKVRGNATIDERLTTDRLTIHTLGTGTSINNLGIDASGNVVVGSSGSTSLYEVGTGTNSTQRKDVGNSADGNYSTTLGGSGNTTGVLASFATIVGGENNSLTGQYNFIGGGSDNSNFSIQWSSIVGGLRNTQQGEYSFIGGGSDNIIVFASEVNSTWSSILGGKNNRVEGDNIHIIGSDITGSTENTTYVNGFNIGTLGTGTSVNNLGIDSSGNVVSGTSSSNTGAYPVGTKVWRNFIKQTGTTAPFVEYSVQNELGEVPTFSYGSVGIYTLDTSNPIFQAGKTIINYDNMPFSEYYVNINRNSDTQLRLEIGELVSGNFTPDNNLFGNPNPFYLEIIILP